MHDDHISSGNATSRNTPLRRWSATARTVLILAMLVACLESAVSKNAAASSGVPMPPAVADRPSSEGGAATVPAPVVKAPTDFRAALEAIHASLSLHTWNDWQLLVDNPERKDRLAWLAKDFGAPVFRQADRVDEAHLHRQAGQLHVGLLVAHFPACKQLMNAYKAVIKAGRSNFTLPVLTMFRSKARGHSLLFLFSETPLQQQVGPLLEKFDSLLGSDLRCTNGK
jgi:hypothetical protein